VRRSALAIVAYAAGAAALAWTVWVAGAGELTRQVQHLRWSFVAAAVAVDAAAYLCQALRWRLLLAGAGRMPWLRAVQIIYIGLFTSEVLPMRPGDGVRAWLGSQALGSSVASIVPSIVVERFFDAVLLAASIGVTAIVMPLPAGLLTAARVLGVAVAGLAGGLAYAALRSGSSRPSRRHDRWPVWLRAAASEIAAGIRAIGRARTTIRALALSCLLLAGQMLAYWLAMRACHIDRPLLVAAAVLTIVRLGTAVPSTPANAGTFQVFTILGLTLFGVERSAAAAFSLAAFAILTVPLWAIGGVALARSGVSVGRNAPAWRTGAVHQSLPDEYRDDPPVILFAARGHQGTGVADSEGRGVR
jgi:uncharacterized membrane protein YbhN (UPF0104 family)